MDSFTDFVNSIADDPIVTKTVSKPRETFPCGQCAGTGKWSGGTNRHGNSNCLACKGKGFFYASYKDRMKAKAKRVERKAKVLDDKRSDFMVAHKDLIDGLSKMQWHSIASSLMAGFTKYGSLTEKQIALGTKIVQEQAERDAKRNATPKAKVDLARVHEIFNSAKAAGKKHPKLNLDGLSLSLAGPNSKNAGAIYVKAGKSFDAEYYGKVMGGEFHKMRSAPDSVTEALIGLAKDPLATATAYGRSTGTCACCGRELTNKASIEAGIGPICAENWGL